MVALADVALLEEVSRFLGTSFGLGSLLGLRDSSSSPSQSKVGLLTDCGIGRSRAVGSSESFREAEGLEMNLFVWFWRKTKMAKRMGPLL